MKWIAAPVLAVFAAWACAASASPPTLVKSPDYAKDAEAFPTLSGRSQAVARINAALRAENAAARTAVANCLYGGATPETGYWWEQAVDVPLLGARYVAFWAHGNQSCGGAHPNALSIPMTFDLASGQRVDWSLLLPDAWLRPGPGLKRSMTWGIPVAAKLKALYIDQARREDLAPECLAAFADRFLGFDFWPDGKGKGLAMAAQALPHAIEGVCGGPVILPLEALQAAGVDAALVHDIGAAGR